MTNQHSYFVLRAISGGVTVSAQVIGAVMAGCIIRRFELGSKGNYFLSSVYSDKQHKIAH